MSEYDFDVTLRGTARLKPGNVIVDHTGDRNLEIVKVSSGTIEYWDQDVPVWFIDARDTRTLKGNRDVKLTCVPRYRWEVVLPSQPSRLA